ncbi:MAG: CBASS cGAMP-activated phospholipase [Hyphomonadaceae bacterium]
MLQQARRKLDWPADREFRLLSIDGGGIKGIFAAALLARLESVHLAGRGLASCFDMIAGTSTGAIISLGLGAGTPASHILDLYMERGAAIFPHRRQFGVLGPAFSSAALAREMKSMFGEQVLGDLTARVCIPSADGRHGDVAVFKTPHHPDFKRDWAMLIKDVALASSAAPTFLRVHEADGYQFIDGGVWANNPVMVGVVDALSCFDIRASQIRILSIGAGMTKPLLGAGPLAFGGALGWLHRGILIESMMHYASVNADGQASLLVGRDRILRVEPTGAAAGVHMTDHAAAKALLPNEANRLAGQFGDEFAAFIRQDRSPPTFYHGRNAAVPIA